MNDICSAHSQGHHWIRDYRHVRYEYGEPRPHHDKVHLGRRLAVTGMVISAIIAVSFSQLWFALPAVLLFFAMAGAHLYLELPLYEVGYDERWYCTRCRQYDERFLDEVRTRV